jgi:Homeodomain-like domain-containing protein
LQDAAVIHAQLSPTEASRLDTLFRSTSDRNRRDRLRIVRMAHRGRARRGIAADPGARRRTATRWVNAYRDSGLDG